MTEIQLDWQSIKGLQASKQNYELQQKLKLDEPVDKALDIFQDDLRPFKHMKAKIVLEEETIPKFCKAPSVPFAIQPKVEVELWHLLDFGIISQVNRSK